ncbi:transposase [Bradyrhizobium sp. RT4b]
MGRAERDELTAMLGGGKHAARKLKRAHRALSEEPRPGAERKLTGKEEVLLVATACAKPPVSRKRWTLTLLAESGVPRSIDILVPLESLPILE